MELLIKMSLHLHLFFIVAMLVLGLINVFISYSEKAFLAFERKIKFLMPLYYMCYASIAFTGLILYASMHFNASHTVYMMIFAWVVIFVMSIKAYKQRKKMDANDDTLRVAYKRFMLQKFSFDLFLLLIVGMLSSML
ncbi:MAG: hypothetical protein IBX44_05095 [Sulfurospirillum sp.]|nr:hypothetical protein [Sulfurospirillum sp.]